MAQFDVYELEDGTRIVSAQSDFASVHETTLVIPLIAPGGREMTITRLNPAFDVDGEIRVLATQFASTIASRQLRAPIASLADHDLAIKGALDFLINGF